MYQEFFVHCIIIMNDAGDGIGRRVVDSYLVVGGGTAGGVLSHFFFLFVLLSFVLSCLACF